MEKEDVKSFSSSCAVEASSCKCDGEELAHKVFKNLIELYDNIDPNEMRLQVEEKDANIAPMRMLNLVLEDDVHYDEMGQEDNYVNQIHKVDDNNNILEEIKQKENLADEKKDDEEAMYLEYDDIPNEFDREIKEEQLEEIQPQREASIFCPIFIQRCKDDCPAAPAR
jgi:hypothetical protein